MDGKKIFCDASLVDANASNNSVIDRERWRRLWRAMIQDYLIAAVQNIRILIAYGYKPKQAGSGLMQGARSRVHGSGRATIAVDFLITLYLYSFRKLWSLAVLQGT